MREICKSGSEGERGKPMSRSYLYQHAPEKGNSCSLRGNTSSEKGNSCWTCPNFMFASKKLKGQASESSQEASHGASAGWGVNAPFGLSTRGEARGAKNQRNGDSKKAVLGEEGVMEIAVPETLAYGSI